MKNWDMVICQIHIIRLVNYYQFHLIQLEIGETNLIRYLVIVLGGIKDL